MGAFTEYKEAVGYLMERLPMFSRIGKAALKPDLTNTLLLCEALGQPQHKFKSIHIAGTNGKGSTSHALTAIFKQAGYSTGLYTSPHLVDFRERIRIDGAPISQEWVVNFVNQYKDTIEAIQPSFFEITVAMAFLAFAEANVDLAIIETGLGGRLDSTNIVFPLLSIITNISYDHQDLLGHTLGAIAFEKAGIIKENTPVVIGEQGIETDPVFFEQAVLKHSTIHYAQDLWDLIITDASHEYQHFKAVNKGKMTVLNLKTDILGKYQRHNLKTVLTAMQVMSHLGYSISDDVIVTALANIKTLTGLRGRWEQLHHQPTIIADVAHNEAGLAEVMEQWAKIPCHNQHIVIGFVKDKEVAAALQQFPKNAQYYFCQANIPRAMPVEDLAQMAQVQQLKGHVYNNVATAVQAALSKLETDDALLITGSFFIVGEALPVLDGHLW